MVIIAETGSPQTKTVIIASGATVKSKGISDGYNSRGIAGFYEKNLGQDNSPTSRHSLFQ